MIIEAKYLDITFDKAGIRNSQKRLKGLIEELAITPLQPYHDTLRGNFELVEEILMKRIASDRPGTGACTKLKSAKGSKC